MTGVQTCALPIWVELGLPRGPERVPAWSALLSVLVASTFEIRSYPTLVVVDESALGSAVAVLQCYYEQVSVLDPEPSAHVAESAQQQSFLDTLSPELAERAYKALARVLHPDVGGNEEAFKALGTWAQGRRSR